MIRRLVAPDVRKTIGIVGLGTAGAAAATFLGRQGHSVKIFERSPIELFDSNRGAGIGIQPIGLTVLKRLGILDPILDLGCRVDHLHSVTQSGTTVLDLKYAHFHPKLYGLGLNRNTLFTELHALSTSTPNVELACEVNVSSVEYATVSGGATGTVAGEKPFIVHSDGAREGPFDLVIVADGRSSIRRNMPIKSFEQPYPFGCLWSSLPDENDVFCSNKALVQKLDSAKVMLGVLPTGKTQEISNTDADLITLFWSIELAKLEAIKAEGIDAWKETVLGYMPQLAPHLDHIKSMDDLIVASYSDTFMPKFHMGDNVVFLGDCAHATSPQLGQGANLALVDAWTLSESMKQSPRDVGRALRTYDEARRWRLRFYQLNSKLLTPLFQSNSKVFGVTRDTFLGAACHFPPTKQLMLMILCGAQNNGLPWTTIPQEEYLHHVQP